MFRRSSCSTQRLPELRHGLTESAARSVAYEVFEKLGYGAVAVTDRHQVLAFVGAGADHHGAGDRPIRPVYEATRARRAAARAARHSHRVRAPCMPARSRRGCAAAPARRPGRRPGCVCHRRLAARRGGGETLEQVGRQLSTQLQLSELHTATTTALQAQMEPHFVFNALNTIASLIRTEPDRARRLVLAFADHLRSRLARPGELVTLDEELRHVQQLPRARAGAVRLAVARDGRRARRTRSACACRRSSSSRWSRTRSSTARPTGRCNRSCARACAAGRCA